VTACFRRYVVDELDRLFSDDESRNEHREASTSEDDVSVLIMPLLEEYWNREKQRNEKRN